MNDNFITWLPNMSPLLIIILMAITFSLAFAGIYYFLITPKFKRLVAENESLKKRKQLEEGKFELL